MVRVDKAVTVVFAERDLSVGAANPGATTTTTTTTKNSRSSSSSSSKRDTTMETKRKALVCTVFVVQSLGVGLNPFSAVGFSDKPNERDERQRAARRVKNGGKLKSNRQETVRCCCSCVILKP